VRFLSILVCLFIIAHTIVLADIFKNNSLKASSDGSNVILQWVTEDETNVARFDVERRTGADGSFLPVASLDAKGVSSYEFVDYSVFRKSTTVYEYRIKVVFLDNSNPVYTGPVSVSHTVSGVRRTWGSIKAMFR
jgi:hypothetical protein